MRQRKQRGIHGGILWTSKNTNFVIVIVISSLLLVKLSVYCTLRKFVMTIKPNEQWRCRTEIRPASLKRFTSIWINEGWTMGLLSQRLQFGLEMSSALPNNNNDNFFYRNSRRNQQIVKSQRSSFPLFLVSMYRLREQLFAIQVSVLHLHPFLVTPRQYVCILLPGASIQPSFHFWDSFSYCSISSKVSCSLAAWNKIFEDDMFYSRRNRGFVAVVYSQLMV